MDGSPSLLFLVVNILFFPYPSLHLFLSSSISYLHLTAPVFTSSGVSPQWTRLPTLCPLWSKQKLMTCSGCQLPIDTGLRVHKCMFFHSGYTHKSTKILPCTVIYYVACIRVGPPFRSRYFGKGTLGLQYQTCATNLPFICELCTTRTQIGRELNPHLPSDMTLHFIEHIRMIDAAHAWAPRTLENA